MPTITIDDATFAEAQDLAEQRHQTVDQVFTSVFRDGLQKIVSFEKTRSGIPLLPVRDTTPVTLEFVNELREEYGG
jgi:hypothetical protein